MILPLLSLALAVICYAIGQLQQHNKLRWQDDDKDYFSFWGKNSWVRKYAGNHQRAAIFQNIKNPNWYYRFFKIKYKERFPLSATLLVWTTDGYHFMQFWMFNFLALSFTLTKEWDWYLFISLMIGLRVVHWIGRKLFSK